MDLELDGKIAFVPASSKGLGKAIAERLLREGANVTISSRDPGNIEECREDLLGVTGVDDGNLLATTCDLMNRSDIEAAVERTVETFGGLDIQVNNHGGPSAVTFDEATEADWRTAFEGVIMSNIWLAEAGLPHLRAQGEGVVLTITSASSREPGANHALSNVFRLGLYGLTKTIAVEYAPAVRANCVTPRFVMTERIEYKVRRRAEHRDLTFDEALSTRVDEVLMNRPGEPAEFADVVALLASPRGSYITGQVVSVDGGWSKSVL